jgi:hypothetical protein
LDLLFIFSSNAVPFEGLTAYTKIAACALLELEGDFAAAAHALRKEGYGTDSNSRSSTSRVMKPFARYATYDVRLKGRPR